METIGDIRLPFHPKGIPAQTRLLTELESTDLADLVSTYSPLLYRLVYSVVRSSAEAEDVVQDVFLRVLRYRADPDTAAILDTRVWLVRIAWNLALDRRRRIRPEQIDPDFAASLVSSSQPADHTLEQAERMQAVMTQLESLPAAERHVLLLSAFEDLSTTEIAHILERSESAVRALLSRARARLRERLEKHDRRKEKR